MGMDVHGRTNDAYFRRNVWGWHLLADLVRALQPDLTSGCKDWHSNSGDGLDEVTSHRLADALRLDVTEGRAALVLEVLREDIARQPREVCTTCGGKGLRTDAVGQQYGYDRYRITVDADGYATYEGGCNACAGLGTRPAWAQSYDTSVASVTEFADFLTASDGFTID